MDPNTILCFMESLSLQNTADNFHMLTKDSIYVVLFSLPIYQLLFYTVQLISFKKENPSKKYLGLMLFFMTTFLVIYAIHFYKYDNIFAYLQIIYLPVLLSMAPAYFLYILSITRENHDVNKGKILLLFLPAIVILFANVLMLGTMDQSSRLDLIGLNILNPGTASGSISGVILGIRIGVILLIFVQIAFVIAKVSKILLREADLMRKQPSHLAYLEWRWILGISVSVLVFLIASSLVEMIVPLKQIGLVVVYNFLMLLAGGITGYLGMKQDTLLSQVERISTDLPKPDLKSLTYAPDEKKDSNHGSFISPAEANEIHKKIIEYMVSEKPYINCDFSMHELCGKLNISRRKTSFVLNEVIQKNFYGMVNEFRIKEAEQLLLKDELIQMKIEALGEMVGFQSKSSFNACFKKVTGMTPSEYRIKMKA